MPARATREKSTSDNDAGGRIVCPGLMMLLPSLRYHDIARTPLSLFLPHPSPFNQPSTHEMLSDSYRCDGCCLVMMLGTCNALSSNGSLLALVVRR